MTTPTGAVNLPTPAAGRGVPLLLLAGLAWGTGGLLGSLLGRETGLTPPAVAAYRLGLGGLLVLAAVAALALATAGGVTSHGCRRLLVGPEHSRSALCRIGLLAVLAASFQACYWDAGQCAALQGGGTSSGERGRGTPAADDGTRRP